MNSFEMTDVEGDALTFITRDGSTWITCTSGADEVTVGPFPTHLLGSALQSAPQGHEQFASTFLGSSVPPHNLHEGPRELRLLAPVSEGADSPAPAAAAHLAPLARREG